METSNAKIPNNRWRTLYIVGAIAPLVALLFYFLEAAVVLSGKSYPRAVEDWMALFGRNPFLGLLYLNAPDILSIAFLGVMFLALYVALKQFNESAMAIAAFFSFTGIVVFLIPRVALLSVYPLSAQYAAATTDAQRFQILAAARALSSLGQATPLTAGFFFLAIAVVILSIVMLRSPRFGRATGIAGILTGLFTMAIDLSTLLAPALANALLPIIGVFWILWWIMISRGLFQLARLENMANSKKP